MEKCKRDGCLLCCAVRAACGSSALDRLKTARDEIDQAIEALLVCGQEHGSRRPMVVAEASIDCAAAILIGVRDQVEACLARTK